MMEVISWHVPPNRPTLYHLRIPSPEEQRLTLCGARPALDATIHDRVVYPKHLICQVCVHRYDQLCYEQHHIIDKLQSSLTEARFGISLYSLPEVHR